MLGHRVACWTYGRCSGTIADASKLSPSVPGPGRANAAGPLPFLEPARHYEELATPGKARPRPRRRHAASRPLPGPFSGPLPGPHCRRRALSGIAVATGDPATRRPLASIRQSRPLLVSLAGRWAALARSPARPVLTGITHRGPRRKLLARTPAGRTAHPAVSPAVPSAVSPTVSPAVSIGRRHDRPRSPPPPAKPASRRIVRTTSQPRGTRHSCAPATDREDRADSRPARVRARRSSLSGVAGQSRSDPEHGVTTE